MCDFEAIAGYGINIVTVQLVARRKTDRVNESVKFRPYFNQFAEQGFDAGIFRNVTRQYDAGTQLSGKLFHTAFQFVVLISERQFSAFAMHSLRDTVGDGKFAGNTRYQNPYSHCFYLL